jgi:hypothetical protein
MTADENKVLAQLNWKIGLEPKILARASGLRQTDCDDACAKLVERGLITFKYGSYRRKRGS